MESAIDRFGLAKPLEEVKIPSVPEEIPNQPQARPKALPLMPEVEEEEVKKGSPGRPKGKRREGEKSGERKREENPMEQYNIDSIELKPWKGPIPIPFVPPLKKPYKVTHQEKFIPQPGFISDFVFWLKGRESPTIFNIWGGLYALAVSSTRQAKIEWEAGNLFPNLYLLFVAPPAVCHKSTAMNAAKKILTKLPERMKDYSLVLANEKKVHSISSKAPGDALAMCLAPRESLYLLPNGTMETVHYGSQAYVAADEFATFMNAKSYNKGLTDTLTQLYDCADQNDEMSRSRGFEQIRDIYFNLAGACTPIHLQTSIPREAFEGGFMSRTVLISQDMPEEFFHKPKHFEGFPQEEELLDKLCWICYHARGEYKMTQEAEDFYAAWYYPWKESLLAKGIADDSYSELRYDVLMLRISCLMRMSEYREGFDITLQNMEDAKKLLDYTFSLQPQVTQMATAGDAKKHYITLRNYIQKQGEVTRKKLLTRMAQSDCMAIEVQQLLSQLMQERLITIHEPLSGAAAGQYRQSHAPSTASEEKYRWIEETLE